MKSINLNITFDDLWYKNIFLQQLRKITTSRIEYININKTYKSITNSKITYICNILTLQLWYDHNTQSYLLVVVQVLRIFKTDSIWS